MKILIAGAGEVGFHLAKLLSFESQNISLIDVEKDNLSYAENHLDIQVIQGDATSIKILEQAQVKEADLLVAVTSSETTNITISVLAKQLGAKRTVARISNQEFLKNREKLGFKKFGIDELISPEWLAAKEIKLLLNQSVFNDTFEFENGALTMVGFRLYQGASFVNKKVKDAARDFPTVHFVPIAIQRRGTQKTVIPRGDTMFKEGDQVYFITTKNGVDDLFKLTGKVRQRIKNVMVLGGSKTGIQTAKALNDLKLNVKLIEQNREKAIKIAEELPKTLVINGDGRNVDILEEENIRDMDAFIAVTGNSETNIISSLLAKSKDIERTIALVENVDYFQLSYSVGVNTLINKKLLAANSIFRYVRKGQVVAISKLNNMNAELLEFIVKPNCRADNTKIVKLKLPLTSIIGGVIREGEGIIALGDFTIKAGDRVVLCCLPQSIKKVEKLFA